MQMKRLSSNNGNHILHYICIKNLIKKVFRGSLSKFQEKSLLNV